MQLSKVFTQKNINSALVVYLVKVSDDYQLAMETYSTEFTKIIGILNAILSKTFTMAEKAWLLDELGFLSSFRCQKSNKRKTNSSKIDQYIVSLILGDESKMASDLSVEMQDMIYFAVESEDHDILLDMWKLGNRGASDLFTPFFFFGNQKTFGA